MDSRATQMRTWMIWLLVAFVLSSPDVDPENQPQAASQNLAVLTREFDSVNNFMMKVDGMRETVRSRESCEDKCKRHDACRSYSWSEEGTRDRPGKTCIWTRKYIGFDPRWTFHTRTYAVDWDGKLSMVGAFHGFPGMRFVEDRYHDEIKPASESDCHEACSADKRCKGFSFNQEKQACLLSDAGLQYAPGFTYYERNKAIEGQDGKFEHYPLEESQAEKEKRTAFEKSEEKLALVDRKIRERKEAEATAQERTIKLKNHKLAEIAEEGANKQAEAKKLKEEEAARLAKLKKDSKAAKVRGEYAEMVHKSKLSVQESKVKIVKERRAKKVVTEQKLNARATKIKTKSAEEQAENSQKKRTSQLNEDIRQSSVVAERLMIEKEIRLLQVEAFKLGQKERENKRPLSLPPHVAKLIKEEETLRQQAQAVAHHLDEAKDQLKAKKQARKAAEEEHSKVLKNLRKRNEEALESKQEESLTKIAQATQLAEKGGAAFKLAFLKQKEDEELAKKEVTQQAGGEVLPEQP